MKTKKILLLIVLVIAASFLKFYCQKKSDNIIERLPIAGKSYEDLSRLHEKDRDGIFVVNEKRLKELKLEIINRFFSDYDSLTFTIFPDKTLINDRISGVVYKTGKTEYFVLDLSAGKAQICRNKRDKAIILFAGFVEQTILRKVDKIEQKIFTVGDTTKIWFEETTPPALTVTNQKNTIGTTINLKSGETKKQIKTKELILLAERVK